MKDKTGIFGGTFDPFHNGHLHALKTFMNKLFLDRVIVIPTGIPPHKKVPEAVSDLDRLEMTKLAAACIPKTIVSEYEILKEGKSYTAETLKHLSNLYPESRFYLFTGSDMFLTIQDWYSPKTVFALAEIVALSRNGQDNLDLKKQTEFLTEKYHASCCLIPIDPICISSTKIREMIKAGEDVSEYLPKKVYDYIKNKNLYI